MIDLQNYEEWFLLYTDNELSSKQKEMVEDFVLRYPYLKNELDALKNTVLSVESSNNNWENLLKKESPIWEEYALLDLDNELNGQEKSEWENILKENVGAQQWMESLSRTKLPIESILFENKEVLLKQINKPRIVPIWIRYSSVAALLIFVFLFILNNQKNKKIVLESLSFNNNSIVPQKDSSKKVAAHLAKIAGKTIQKPQKNVVGDNSHVSVKAKKRIHFQNETAESIQTEKDVNDKIIVDNLAAVASPKPIEIAPVASQLSERKPSISNAVYTEKTQKETKSSKRFVMLDDADGEKGKLYVANAEINTQKLFGWLKKNKFGKSKENTKKVEIANFEISLKTNEL
ncbi:MAG: hypothetical protein DI598_08210 [Pseudopedobacter saltans]|uniref:Uncharacterized protein n=1 Tax=Pseudopedobacter saltans TaxID=151895 RepID=A0A2W5EZ79_9SPHI|nr:MAG: hypothetical protein DI598_08210 [Pseudopedobacter saltans]